MIADFSGAERDGPAAFDAIAAERKLRVVTYPEWQILNRLEEENAAEGAPRKKFITPDEMLTALDRTN